MLTKSIVQVDRSIRGIYPNQFEVLHPELESTGPTKFDVTKLEPLGSHYFLERSPGIMVGEDIFRRLESSGILKECLGLRDLEEMLMKGRDFLRKYFAGKSTWGWKAVSRNAREGWLEVPFIWKNQPMFDRVTTPRIQWHCLKGDYFGGCRSFPSMKFPGNLPKT